MRSLRTTYSSATTATSVFQIVLCHFTVLKSKSCCSYNLCQLNFNLLLTVLQHKLECIIVSVETICPERFLSCFRPSPFISIHKSLCDHFLKRIFVRHCALLCLFIYCELLTSTFKVCIILMEPNILRFLLYNLIVFKYITCLHYFIIVGFRDGYS